MTKACMRVGVVGLGDWGPNPLRVLAELSYRTGDITSPKLSTEEPLAAQMQAFEVASGESQSERTR
jgi:hypothetical protein